MCTGIRRGAPLRRGDALLAAFEAAAAAYTGGVTWQPCEHCLPLYGDAVVGTFPAGMRCGYAWRSRADTLWGCQLTHG